MSAEAVHARPQFLRLFVVRLLGSEGNHAQHDAVAQVRADGAWRLRRGLARCYAPWGESVAERIAGKLGGLALALFDGISIAGQAAEHYDGALVDQAAATLHARAQTIRASG